MKPVLLDILKKRLASIDANLISYAKKGHDKNQSSNEYALAQRKFAYYYAQQVILVSVIEEFNGLIEIHNKIGVLHYNPKLP